VADVEKALSELRDHVGRAAAGRDCVVQPGEVRRVLAEQFDRVHGQDQGVEGRPPLLGRPAGVSRLAVEAEFDGDPGQARRVAGRIPAAGVPVQAGVAVGEQPGPGHEHLGRPALLGRAAVEPHRPLDGAGFDLLRHGHRRRRRRHPEQVVPTRLAVPGPALPRLPDRDGLLGQFRQGVVLAQDADHRLALAERGRERGRNLGNAPFDLEPGLFEGVGEQGGRPLLQISGLGVLPDPRRHVPGRLGPGLDGLHNVGLVGTHRNGK
jgi:hypothetical protein